MRIPQNKLFLTILLIGLFSINALSDGNDRLIDDAIIKVLFETKLGELKDENKTTDASLISEQLKEQNKIHAALPEVPTSGLHSSEIYKNRKNGRTARDVAYGLRIG